MKNCRPRSCFRAGRASTLLVALLAATSVEASGVATKPLPRGPLTLEANDIRLEVEVAPDITTEVRVVDARTGADLGKRLEARLRETGSFLKLLGGEPNGEERPVLKLRVRKGQQLEFAGSRLDVVLEGRSGPRPVTAAAPKSEPVIVGRVKESSVRATGLSGPEAALFLTAEGSDVHLDDCESVVDARLSGGALGIRDHRGIVRFTGKDADVHLEGGVAELTASLDGGTATVRDGEGALSLSSNGGKVWVDRWTGAMSLVSISGNLEVARSTTKSVSLKMTDSHARLLNLSGRAEVKCESGGLQVESFEGPLTVSASERAAVNLAGVSGALRLAGVDAARLEVREARGPVTLTASGGVVDVERVASLKLDAAESEVRVREIQKLLPTTLSGCAGELDLVETGNSSSISVTAGSRIEIRIAEPCEVQATGPGATLGSGITCSGCDLKLPNRPRLGRPKQYIRGTRRMILALSMDEDSRVTIDAR